MLTIIINILFILVQLVFILDNEKEYVHLFFLDTLETLKKYVQKSMYIYFFWDLGILKNFLTLYNYRNDSDMIAKRSHCDRGPSTERV